MADIKGLLGKYKKIEGERFFDDIFNHGEYQAIRENVVIDVGACAGEFSAYIYDMAQIIYALEPEDEHYKELTNNIIAFRLDKIKPYKLALAGSNGKRKLILAARGGHKLDMGDVGDQKTEEVETITLATFIKDNAIKHVDILKIDVEGAEDEVFKAKDFFEVAPRISCIISEHLGGSDQLLVALGFHYNNDGASAIYKR